MKHFDQNVLDEWNPTTCIAKHMAYLTARLKQPIQQFLPICSPYGTAQKRNEYPFIRRAVRYAIWVAVFIAGFPWRAVRYALWVEKTITPINPCAVRYTIWNPASRIAKHMAYLTARLNQSNQQFLPICSPYGTAQKRNEHPIIARAVRYAIWILEFNVMNASMLHQHEFTTINQTQ